MLDYYLELVVFCAIPIVFLFACLAILTSLAYAHTLYQKRQVKRSRERVKRLKDLYR